MSPYGLFFSSLHLHKHDLKFQTRRLISQDTHAHCIRLSATQHGRRTRLIQPFIISLLWKYVQSCGKVSLVHCALGHCVGARYIPVHSLSCIPRITGTTCRQLGLATGVLEVRGQGHGTLTTGGRDCSSCIGSESKVSGEEFSELH